MRYGLSVLCSSFLWALVLAQPGFCEHVTNRATRTKNGAGTPLRGARALNVTRWFFIFLRATIFVCDASKTSVKMGRCWFGKRHFSGFTKHAGANCSTLSRILISGVGLWPLISLVVLPCRGS